MTHRELAGVGALQVEDAKLIAQARDTEYPMSVASIRVMADQLEASGRRVAELEAAASQRASDLAKARSLGATERHIVAELWRHLTDEQRLELIGLCCCWCGTLDPRCCCQRDD